MLPPAVDALLHDPVSFATMSNLTWGSHIHPIADLDHRDEGHQHSAIARFIPAWKDEFP